MSSNSDPKTRGEDLSHPGLLIPVLLTVAVAGVIVYYGIWRAVEVAAVARALIILFGLVPFVVGIWIAYSMVRRLRSGRHS